MSNHIIIDGWNVCWKIPELVNLIPGDLARVRSLFNQKVAGYFAGKKITYRIVYDGQPLIHNEDSLNEKQVFFSSNPEKADDLIIRFLQKQRNKKNWTVITSDNSLSLQARDLGASAISSEEFINRMNKKKSPKSDVSRKTEPRIDRDDIAYWLDKFSGHDENNG